MFGPDYLCIVLAACWAVFGIAFVVFYPEKH